MARTDAGRPRFEEEWLVAVLDCLSEGVVALRHDGSVVAANPAAEHLLGFRIAERRDQPWDQLSWRTLVDEDGATVPGTDHPITAVLRDGTTRRPHVVGLPQAAEMRWLALATHVLGGPAAPGGAVVSFQDVTDRVASEHERQRLIAALRDVMSSTSHDLRSPLVAILGATQLLREDWADLPETERLRGLDMVHRQAQKVHRLVDDLSVMSRLEGGALRADTQVVTVAQLVDATLDEIPDRSGVGAHVDPGLRVLVDPDHGRRMLVNLVDNAVKHGDPPVTIAAERADRVVRVTVTDRGAGVPDDVSARLFERFSRGSSDRAVAGMGLGLAIVDRLARLNGGAVIHDPGWPEGTRFELLLPAAT